MNQNDSSSADQGHDRNGVAPLDASRRTAASALLAATDIWSTNDVSPQEIEVASPPASAEISSDVTCAVELVELVSVPEPKSIVALDASQQSACAEPVESTPPFQSSEAQAEARFFSLQGRRSQENRADKNAARVPELSDDTDIACALERQAAKLAKTNAPSIQPVAWPPQRLSLALQGGGSFGAFTWGVLERLLEEPTCDLGALSGASVGAINAALLASGMVQGGREGARKSLATFWQRIISEPTFRSLMLIGGFSSAGCAVAFGPNLRASPVDPFDLDPLREVLVRDIDFSALRSRFSPQLFVSATRVRDGRQQIFDNAHLSADVLLASTSPPLAHCAVEIEGVHYWDGGYGANPPLIRLLEESASSDLLVVQVTPARDNYVPVTMAAIDRRRDQITANAVLNAELNVLEWARHRGLSPAKIHRLAAEDEIEGLAQRDPSDLGRSFVAMLHGRGRSAADRWLRGSAAVKETSVVTFEEAPILVDA